jgi:hypothetical protein
MASRKLKCKLDCDGQIVVVGKSRLRCKKCRQYYAIIKVAPHKPKLKLNCVIYKKKSKIKLGYTKKRKEEVKK